MAAVPLASAALPYVARPFSLAIGTVLLTLAYKLVPARQVPLRAALIGGLLAAVAFEGAKFGFALYITNVRTYQIVYGALAALPLFLIWIYCRIILLVGRGRTPPYRWEGAGSGAARDAVAFGGARRLAESRRPS